MRRIDGYATLPHYLEHCAAVWRALPTGRRGTFYVPAGHEHHARALGIAPKIAPRPPIASTPVLVAGWTDLQHTPGRPAVLIEHGAGQHYLDTRHRAHPGGPQRGRVGLYLCPNRDVADRNLAAYPEATAAVVGAPHLDHWHARPVPDRAGGPVVISWHFDSAVAPEARSAWPHYGPAALEQLRTHLGGRLHGHGHPRILDRLRPIYQQHDIPVIDRFTDVLHRAALYVCDNSSTMYEAASIGIPVVALNAPWYRRDIDHGLRFWSHVPGPQVDDPDQLTTVIDQVLDDPTAALACARPAVARAYIACDGRSAHRAAGAVGEWLDRPPSGASG